MKVNFGAIATDGRGKVKGIVYSKNKSGAYVRGKVTPANPRSTRQTLVRSSFAQLAKDWSAAISQTGRNAWISYANTFPRIDIFGASIKISGLNMYISLNQVLANIGIAPASLPPASNVVFPIGFDDTAFAPTHPNTGIIINQTGAISGANKYYVFAARPLPAGRQAQLSDFRFLESVAQVAVAGPVDISAAYAAKFGFFATNQRIAILVATVDPATGLTTAGTQFTAIVL